MGNSAPILIKATVTMSKPFDYSKWDNIELSDDEDDVHPNIERESWFRMKHRARVEREEKEDEDKAKIHKEVRKIYAMCTWTALMLNHWVL